MKRITKNIISILLAFLIIMPLFTKTIIAEGTYTDNETGVSFTIPKGWKAIGLSKDDRKVAKERFSTGKSGEVFVYLSANLYNQLSNEQKEQFTKDSFDGYRLTEADAKEMFANESGFDSYTMEKIAGEKWCVLKNDLLDYYVQYINGNMIAITISKVMSEDKIKQVKSVIEEITKSEVAKENNSTITETATQVNTNSSSSLSIEEDNARLLKNLLIWIGIALIFFFIKTIWTKKGNKKEYITCSKCGTENDKTNRYCIKCGEQLHQ